MSFILFLHVLLTALSFSLGRETSENYAIQHSGWRQAPALREFYSVPAWSPDRASWWVHK